MKIMIDKVGNKMINKIRDKMINKISNKIIKNKLIQMQSKPKK